MSCGSHGAVDEYGQCQCFNDPGYTDKDGAVQWYGMYCQKPPANVPCKKSSDEERKKLGGDLACGNYGQYGTCNTNGTCDCGLVNPFKGSRCQNACESDMDCGGPKMPYTTPEGTTINRDIGLCNRKDNTCSCKNGWSGVQCRTPPPDAKPYDAADCAWGGVAHGTFNEDTKQCICFKDERGRPLYEGPLCTLPIVYEGAPCSSKEPCRDKTAKCVDGTCHDTDTVDKTKLSEIFLTCVQGLFTWESINFILVDVGLTKMAKFFSETVVKQILEKVLLNSFEAFSKEAAFAALTKTVGEELAVKITAQVFTKEVVTMSATALAEASTAAVADSVTGPIGAILFLLQVWGMGLDVADGRGLQQMMLQGHLDMLGASFVNEINGVKELVDLGVTMPLPVTPDTSVPFQIQFKTTENYSNFIKYIGDYISALTVNSDGQVIVPLFNPPDEVERNERKAKYPLYWKMAQDNNDVFDRLTKYGWLMWVLGSLVVVLVVLTCVFSAPAVKRRLHK